MTIPVIDALKSIQIQEQNKQILFPVDSLMDQVRANLKNPALLNTSVRVS